ncbi:MAG: DUF1905 domain-containing protein [Rhodoglobus sp.]
MTTDEKIAQDLDISFTAILKGGVGPRAWTVLTVPGSGEALGTRRPVKIGGTIDGAEFRVTLLPNGDGTHMLPIAAALRKSIGKEAPATVAVHITQRFS